MKVFLIKISFFILTIFILLLMLSTYGFAEDDFDSKFYFKLNSLNVSFVKGFTGNQSYNANLATYYAPNIADNNGFGIALGELRNHFAGEISYSYSKHQGTYPNGTSDDCYYEKYGFDFKYYILNPELNYNFFILAGAGVSKVKAVNGAVGSSTSDDALFTGISYDLGLGATVKLRKNLSIEGSYLQNQFYIEKIEGLETSLKPSNNKVLINSYQLNIIFWF